MPPAPTSFFQPGFWRRHWLPSLLLIVASFGLYQASIKFGYVLDDEIVISKNKFVQEGFGGIGKIFGADSFMGYFQKKEDLFRLEGGRYRPLSLATFAVEIGLWGLPEEAAKDTGVAGSSKPTDKPGRGIPWLSHVLNILLYGLNGVLLYRILLGFFPAGERKWWFGTAFFGALIFIFHPLHSEAVANIKGRDEILALMGSLGALYATMKYFDRPHAGWLVLSGVSFLLGLFSKENTLTFLAVIPFSIWFFGRVSAGRAASASWPLVAAALVFIVVRYNALGYMVDHGKAVRDLMNDSFLGMTLGERLATISLTLGWYVKLLFVPYPLTHDYYPYHVPKVGWTDWRALLSLALYVGMSVWAWRNLRQRAVPAYAIVFWLLTLSIVSNLFVSVGSFMNERFIYMPSVAFCLLAGWFLAEKLPNLIKNTDDQPNLLGSILLAGALAAFAWITIDRVPDWENALSLNTSAVRHSPGSARAQSFYTTSVYQELYTKASDPAEKIRWVDTMEVHIKKALEINPNYGSAWVMRANIAWARFDQDHQMDRFFNELTACLEKNPGNTMMRNNIDQYMRYIATKGGNPNKINAFAYRMGYEYFYQQRKDKKSALQFLEYGAMTQTNDERVMTALAELRK